MDLEMKAVSTEFAGFKPNELAALSYDEHSVNIESENKSDSEPINWSKLITKANTTADIVVRCTICEESTPMNSQDCRARGVFICDKCRAAILHIRKLLENGGSVV